ncbi:hypothetical protein ZIOFF_031253 [Zingiber officinale]|uniref:Non-haem dioxygenase N-terminal domain-containing protein n=1 Tax=Zingiber officinale TaxID=94328 RepID=A0A8J5L4Y7_ZINOF|nr:hypothetical protein ZIOFF_031253 [Zingiber officinale]
MPTAAGQIQPPRQYHHGTHHLDFESAIEVPDSHAWPDLDDLPSAAAAASPGTSVPVVDLSVSVDAVLGQLASACAAWGAFQVTGHGVPPGLLLRAEAASRRLFALPTSHKLRAARPAEGGASGYGTARISCFFPKLMWSEGFTIAGSPLEHARTLWPAGDPLAFWYKSVVHRAVVDRSRHRISVAYMCGPQKDAKVSPLEKLVEAQGRAAYRAVTWPEYLNLKGKLFGMALESCQEDMLVDE